MSALFLGHPCWPVLSTASCYDLLCASALSQDKLGSSIFFFLLDELASKSYNPQVLPAD